MIWPLEAIANCIDNIETWNPRKADTNDSFLYLDLSSIDKEKKVIDSKSVNTVFAHEAPSRARQIVMTQDVIVATVRPNLNGVAYIDDDFHLSTASTGYCVLRCNEKLDPKYLYYWVCGSTFIRDMVKKATGANYPAVSDKIIKQSLIPLPPLNVQRNIAKILDQANQLRQQAAQLETELNQLAQTVFQEMFGDPVENLKKWPMTPLSVVVKAFQGGKSLGSIGEDTKTKNRVLKISSVTWRDFNPTQSKPVSDDYEPPSEHFVKKDDLLFSRANTTELVGATSYVWDDYEGYLLPDKLWRFIWKDEDKIDQLFIWNLMMNPTTRRELGKLATGSGGSMKNISKKKLLDFKIPLPPHEEQKKYGDFYRNLHSTVVENRKQTIELETLFQSLTQKAFKDELRLPETP